MSTIWYVWKHINQGAVDKTLTKTHTHFHKVRISSFLFFVHFLSFLLSSLPISLYLPLCKNLLPKTNMKHWNKENSKRKLRQRINDTNPSRPPEILNRPTTDLNMNKYKQAKHTTKTKSESVLLWLKGFGLNRHAGLKTWAAFTQCVCVWPKLFSPSAEYDAKFTPISSMRKTAEAFKQRRKHQLTQTSRSAQKENHVHTCTNRGQAFLSGTSLTTEWSNRDV